MKKTVIVVRRFLTVIGVVACVILIPILIFNLLIIIKGSINKNEIPSLFSVSSMYVMTGSMSPSINAGDLVFIKKVSASEIVVDDVIAYFDPENTDKIMIAHRVKEIFTDGDGNISFLTKGDANTTNDVVPVPAENLIGRYILRLRGMGSVAMFMQSTSGVIVCVSVPLILLIIGEIIRIVSDRKEGDESVNVP